MGVHERIVMYADILYQQGLASMAAKRYRRAEITASAAAGAAVFLVEDPETSDSVKNHASMLSKAAEELMGDARRLDTETYGERFLSGKDPVSVEVSGFIRDLRESAMKARGQGVV